MSGLASGASRLWCSYVSFGGECESCHSERSRRIYRRLRFFVARSSK